MLRARCEREAFSRPCTGGGKENGDAIRKGKERSSAFVWRISTLLIFTTEPASTTIFHKPGNERRKLASGRLKCPNKQQSSCESAEEQVVLAFSGLGLHLSRVDLAVHYCASKLIHCVATANIDNLSKSRICSNDLIAQEQSRWTMTTQAQRLKLHSQPTRSWRGYSQNFSWRILLRVSECVESGEL